MGLDQYGFKRPEFADILAIMEQKAREYFGESIDTTEKTPLGKYIRTIAWDYSLRWDALEGVYFSAFPDTASGVSLDRLGPFAVVTRNPATPAYHLIKFMGTPNATIAAGSLVGTQDDINFYMQEPLLLDANGEGYGLVECVTPGSVGNVSYGSIDKIVNPIAYLDSIEHQGLRISGHDIESDADFRRRFKIAFRGIGSATSAAVLGEVYRVKGILSAAIVENDQDFPDADGRPSHCFEVYAIGGDDQDIANAILRKKPAGVLSFGDVLMKAKDIAGTEHEIRFSRIVPIVIFVRVRIKRGAAYANDGDDRIRDQLVAQVGGTDTTGAEHIGLGGGQTVVQTRLYDALYNVQGIRDSQIDLSLDGQTWGQNNIAVGVSQIARLYAANIVFAELL